MAKQILGRVSIYLRGDYNSTTNYETLDVVTYNGSSYACLKDCVGIEPTNTTYWQLLAEKGEQGEQGQQGEQGATGSIGATPNIQIGTVSTLEPNSQATVTRTGTNENPIFNFGIPKGEQGATPSLDGYATEDYVNQQISSAIGSALGGSY